MRIQFPSTKRVGMVMVYCRGRYDTTMMLKMLNYTDFVIDGHESFG